MNTGLEQDARLRTDFNIPGMKTADMEHVKYKSKMKPYYAAAGIPTARYHLVTDLTESLAFVEKVGYPVYREARIRRRCDNDL